MEILKQLKELLDYLAASMQNGLSIPTHILNVIITSFVFLLMYGNILSKKNKKFKIDLPVITRVVVADMVSMILLSIINKDIGILVTSLASSYLVFAFFNKKLFSFIDEEEKEEDHLDNNESKKQQIKEEASFMTLPDEDNSRLNPYSINKTLLPYVNPNDIIDIAILYNFISIHQKERLFSENMFNISDSTVLVNKLLNMSILSKDELELLMFIFNINRSRHIYITKEEALIELAKYKKNQQPKNDYNEVPG